MADPVCWLVGDDQETLLDDFIYDEVQESSAQRRRRISKLRSSLQEFFRIRANSSCVNSQPANYSLHLFGLL